MKTKTIEQLKKGYWDEWNKIRESRHDYVSSFELLRSITVNADRIVTEIAEYSGFPAQNICIIALGGYARGEMTPYSDIDLLILHKGELDVSQEEFLQTFTTSMWDLKLLPGIQIKELNEIQQFALEDEIVRTSFMDNRLILGDNKLYENFKNILKLKVMGRGKKEFLILKISEVRRRSKKYRDSIYRLEPNIKEGGGGIRDLNTIYWITKTLYGSSDLDYLIKQRIISVKDYEKLRKYADFLFRVRCELHYFHGRKYDVLNLESQKAVADELVYSDTVNVLAVEQFLKDYYIAARTIADITETVLESTISKIAPKHPSTVTKPISLGYGFYKYNRYLSVNSSDIFKKEPLKLLKIFKIATKKGLKFSDATMQLIRENLYLIDEAYVKKYGRYFLDIISNFPNSAKIVNKLIKTDVFFQFIPEFKHIVCKAQFDMYHHYTVDEHTVIALRYIDDLSSILPSRYHVYQEVFKSLKRKDLLALTILLHDIGKGQGKNHSELGAKMAVGICRRLGLNMDESDIVSSLIRHHLLMSHISQRRDLHDIEVIDHFISYFDDEEDIKLLYLLTYADMNAVGGQVFSEWKNMLLTELYEKSIKALSAESLTAEFDAVVARKKRKISERYENRDFVSYALNSMDDEYVYSNKLKHIYRHLGMILQLSTVNNVVVISEKRDDLKCVEFTVCTYDFIGLLRKLAGVFSLYDMNILGAQIYTFDNNIAIDTIQVSNLKEHTEIIDEKSSKIQETIKKVINHELEIDKMLEEKTESFLSGGKKSVTKQANKIVFDNDISTLYTVVDVYTEDKVGLLYNLLTVFEKMHINVVKAKISTDVDRVVDSFYIIDKNKNKIISDPEISRIKLKLMEILKEAG